MAGGRRAGTKVKVMPPTKSHSVREGLGKAAVPAEGRSRCKTTYTAQVGSSIMFQIYIPGQRVIFQIMGDR